MTRHTVLSCLLSSLCCMIHKVKVTDTLLKSENMWHVTYMSYCKCYVRAESVVRISACLSDVSLFRMSSMWSWTSRLPTLTRNSSCRETLQSKTFLLSFNNTHWAMKDLPGAKSIWIEIQPTDPPVFSVVGDQLHYFTTFLVHVLGLVCDSDLLSSLGSLLCKLSCPYKINWYVEYFSWKIL